MIDSEERLQSLVLRAEQRERTARRRAVYYSLIPVVVAALLLGFIGWQIYQADQQLEKTTQQLDGTTRQLEATQVELQTSQTKLTSVNEALEKADQQIIRSQQQLTTTQELFIQTQQELTQTQVLLEQKKQDVARFEEEAKSYRSKAEDLQKQVDELQQQVDDLTVKLELATAFQNYRVSIQLEYLLKEGPSPLDEIYRLRDVPWKRGGFSPEEGFDSPSFAAYVLEQSGLLPVPASSARYRLREVLPARSGSPQVGDVVFYPIGYTMFYFEDYNGSPFVIGMTPLGVLALKPDWTKPIGYGAVHP